MDQGLGPQSVHQRGQVPLEIGLGAVVVDHVIAHPGLDCEGRAGLAVFEALARVDPNRDVEHAGVPQGVKLAGVPVADVEIVLREDRATQLREIGRIALGDQIEPRRALVRAVIVALLRRGILAGVLLAEVRKHDTLCHEPARRDERRAIVIAQNFSGSVFAVSAMTDHHHAVREKHGSESEHAVEVVSATLLADLGPQIACSSLDVRVDKGDRHDRAEQLVECLQWWSPG
ncbi:hypothetical protein CPZ06_10015 [Lactobacillus acidophilus]|nr:hypothetical protein CPZ06_10015 [Lactobacillus acidophilus]